MTAYTDIENQKDYQPLRNKDRQIQRDLFRVSDAVRDTHPWLVKHQDAVGMSIFIGSITGMIAGGILWVAGVLSAWQVVLLNALWASLLHELEHDLIHRQYFRKQPFWQNLMMTGVYLARPLTINPWVRRYLHLHHHKVSGTETDLEERAITNGERWGLRRLLMVGDNMLAVYLRARQYITIPRKLFREGKLERKDLKNLRLIALFSYFPVGVIAYTIWHCFLLFYAANGIAWVFGTSIEWPSWLLAQKSWIDLLVVVLLAPNVLRTFCLHFISSNLHYYGDNQPGIVHQQCQVLNKWYFLIPNLFSVNFGGTHVIHHFVVRDPFYIRLLAEKGSHRVLRQHGIRFNDMGTFARANRLNTLPS